MFKVVPLTEVSQQYRRRKGGPYLVRAPLVPPPNHLPSTTRHPRWAGPPAGILRCGNRNLVAIQPLHSLEVRRYSLTPCAHTLGTMCNLPVVAITGCRFATSVWPTTLARFMGAETPAMWRRLWRSLGMAVGKLLPVCYKPLAPPRASSKRP